MNASIGRLRWLVLAILFFDSAVVNKLAQKTTQTAAFFAPEMGFDAVQVGELNAAWMIGMIPAALLTGLLAAKIGAKRVLVFTGVLMCILSPAMAFVTSFEQIYALNIASGACLGMIMPAGAIVIARWFPPAEVAGAAGIFIIAGALAGIVLNPLYLWVTEVAGWREQSLVTTILVVVALVLTVLTKESPKASKRISRGELALIVDAQDRQMATGPAGTARSLLAPGAVLLLLGIALVSASTVQFNWLWYAVLGSTDVSAGTLGIVTSIGFIVTGIYALFNGRAIRSIFRGRLNIAMSVGAIIGVCGFFSCAFLLAGNWVAWSLMLTLIVMMMTPLCFGTATAYFAVQYGPAAAGAANGITGAVGLAIGFFITSYAGNWVNPDAVGLAQYQTIWVVAAALCVPLAVIPWLIAKVQVIREDIPDYPRRSERNSVPPSPVL